MLEEAEMSQVVNGVTSSSKRPYRKGTHLALLINSDLQWQRKGPPIKKLKCFWNHSSKKY
jgi:hypothetical protein